MDIEFWGFKVYKKKTGMTIFNLAHLLKQYIYVYFNGIKFSRKQAKQFKINREIIWLIKDIKQIYIVNSEFRKDNIEVLEKLFNNFVSCCMDLDLYGKELIDINITKLEISN